MSEESLKHVVDRMVERGAFNQPCPRCGKIVPVIINDKIEKFLFVYNENGVSGASVIAATCSNCGFISLYNLDVYSEEGESHNEGS